MLCDSLDNPPMDLEGYTNLNQPDPFAGRAFPTKQQFEESGADSAVDYWRMIDAGFKTVAEWYAYNNRNASVIL